MGNVVKTKNDYKVSGKIEKHNIEKIRFLSHISHGIRTPLNSIMGFSKLLVLKKLVDPKQKEYVQGILSGSNLLLQFVENIMDLSQFEANNYSLRIKNYAINQILWDFTEDFYLNKNENSDTNINLMLVWENKVKDLEIESDAELLKKAIQRLINLVVVRFPNIDIEMGYRVNNNNSLSIYIRPSKENLTSVNMLNEDQFYSIDESESFDYFNYKVLVNAVTMLGGELGVNPENQEFILEIPINFERNKNLI
jgi:K+-sensing histidine kinase KdpD